MTIGVLRTAEAKKSQQTVLGRSYKGFAVCTVLFVLCMLVSLAPLKRFAGTTSLQLPTNDLLTLFGNWLPVDLHFTQTTPYLSQWTTHVVLFLAFIGLGFALYLLAACLLPRYTKPENEQQSRRLVWLATVVLGLILVLMPAMLSHDIFVYAGYARVLVTHYANPYVTTLSQFPQDVFLRLDDWRDVPSAYGPIWLAISGLLALIAGDDPGRTMLLYRLFALAAHLLNIALIARILRKMGRSPRTITLGMLLYGWNPLVLEESSLGGHNDVFMVTLLLLGLMFDAQQTASTGRPQLRTYLPALTALTLAILIKFTAAPVLVLYFVLLARRAYGTQSAHVQRVKAVALTLIPAGFFSGALALALYVPYWHGFTLEQIIFTFTSPPSSQSSYGSILYALVVWNQAHVLPATGSWQYYALTILGQHRTWNAISLAVLGTTLLTGAIWIWRSPTTRTLALTALSTLAAVLVVTFWFYPWYIIWIVGLAVIALPVTDQRWARTLVAFTLMFSLSALSSYLYANFLSPLGGWNWLSCVVMLAPPLLTLLLFLALPAQDKRKICL